MTKYSLPLYARLVPRTPVFEGGRLIDTDLLTLDEAADMATEHAGRLVRVRDFLRAGEHDEIPLYARVPRAATLLPVRDGDPPVQAVAGAFTTLPVAARAALTANGATAWRGLEDRERCEALEGELARFERWRLADTEPDFTVALDGVMVKGCDVHALADAFMDPPPESMRSIEPQAEPVAADTGAETHKAKRRADPLAAVLAEAKRQALDSADWHSVWAALVKLAESASRPAPLRGYAEGEGVLYQTDDAAQPLGHLSREAFRKRFGRS